MLFADLSVQLPLIVLFFQKIPDEIISIERFTHHTGPEYR